MSDRLSRFRRRLQDESGMALVMAIGISFVLAILGASVILFTTSNERHANRQNATTKVYDIAQAGIDSAASQLGALAPDDPNLRSATFFTSLPASSRTAAIDKGSVTWTGTLIDPTPPTYTWRLSATATMPSPTQPGVNLTRTLTADLPLVPQTWQVPNTDTWRFIYSRANDGDPNTCDQTIQNNPGIVSSIYVNGDLCLDNSSNIYGPSGPGTPPVDVVVKGRAYLNHPATSLGTVARPLSSIQVEGGCKYRNNPLHSPPLVCSAIDSVWPNSIYSGLAGTICGPPAAAACPVVTAPAADYTTWYTEASPGPTKPCEQASGPVPDLDGANPLVEDVGGTVDLAPGSSYTCKTRLGELSWNAATRVLTVTGTVWIDGNAELSSDGVIRYSGFGAIYLAGSYRQRQTIVCAQLNGAGSACDPAWTNSADNVLLIVTKRTGTPAQTGAGMSFEQSSAYQGALFAAGNITFENNTWVQGPMIAERELINNSMFFNYIPVFVRVPFGAPGTVITHYNLTPIRHYAG